MRVFVCSLALVASVLVTACSTGGGGAADVIDPIDELPTEIEPEIVLGPTGTATYQGPIALAFIPELSATVELSGTLALAVDFAGGAGSVTGDAANFETAEGGVVDGRLFLSSGALEDRETALLMASQLSGSLRSGTDSYLIFGQMAGEVLGDSQSAITGQVSGTARQSGIDGPLSGSFQTGRQP